MYIFICNDVIRYNLYLRKMFHITVFIITLKRTLYNGSITWCVSMVSQQLNTIS